MKCPQQPIALIEASRKVGWAKFYEMQRISEEKDDKLSELRMVIKTLAEEVLRCERIPDDHDLIRYARYALER